MARVVIQCGRNMGDKYAGEEMCSGELEFIARTKRYRGMQYGDVASAAFFYVCRLCRRVYFANICPDEETEGYPSPSLVEALVPYNGELSVEEIRKAIPKLEGNWYESVEEEALLALNKLVLPVVVTVNAEGHICVPRFKGRKVKVTLFNEAKESK